MRAGSARATRIAFVLLVALALAGCGGAGTSDPTAAPTSAVRVLADNPTVAATVTAPPSPIQRPAPAATPSPTATPTAPPPTPTPAPRAPKATETPTPEPPTPTPTPDACPGAIPWDQAIGYVGQEVTVIGPVASATWATESRGQPTFINLGLPYPDPGRFTVLLWIDARWRFDAPPEEMFAGKTVCVTGVVELYRGGAEIVVEYPWQIVAP